MGRCDIGTSFFWHACLFETKLFKGSYLREEMVLDPVFIRLGSLEIRYYGILFALAFFVGYWLLIRLAKERNIAREVVEDLLVWMIPLVVVGARLFEVLVYEPAYYFANPLKIIAVWEGGLASHGGIIGAVLALWIVARRHKMHFYVMADLAAIPFVLGAAFIRLGNFFNGELVGRVTSVPWAVQFPGYEGLRHPSQLYEMAKNVFIFGILWNLRRKVMPQGFLFWLGLFLFSFLRFFVEFFKEFPVYYGLNIGQYLSLVAMAVSGFFLMKVYRK